jgi:ATP/maltotriose-dependent transcriptional regulator MalT/two-component SAPR family response regulator
MRSSVSENIRILKSKLTAPSVGDTVVRDRLLASMNHSPQKRLTTIVAGAGYGKTTLAAQAVSHRAGKTLWYRLDASDRDLVTFLSYLIAGMRMYHPEFGAETLDYLRKSHNPAGELPSALTMFVSELEERSREDLVIVLDDYHSVHESPEIREAMEILLRDLSPSAHMILTSRSEPALPLSRLRAMREVTDIREEDLAFTSGEIERLYSQVFDFTLDRADIDTVRRTVGGWASGLILLCHSLRRKPAAEIVANLMSLRGSRRAIFNYLEENVYGSLSPEQQEFLIKTSIFPRVTTALCDRLLNVRYSADVLRYLEDNHLFTSSIDRKEHWYAYHQLFRDFLMSRLEDELDHASVVKLHRDAALILENSGEEEEAVGHFLEAGEVELACGLLKHAGARLFSEGRFQLLDSYLGRIPADFLDKHPWVRFQQAKLEGLRGKLQAAVQKYRMALDCFIEQKDRDGVQSCLVESGLIDFQTGDLRKARDRFQELLEQPDLDPKLLIEIQGYLIYISSHFGQMDLADRCFDEAISLTCGLDEAVRHPCLLWLYYYRGFRYAFSGDYDRVIEVAETMKAICRSKEPDEIPPGYHLLMSMACYHSRLYSRGFECAREGLTLLREGRTPSGAKASGWSSPRLSPRGERGFPDVSRCWLLAFAALNAAELGNMAGTLEDAEESLRCFRKMGCGYGEPFAYFVLHDVHLKSGDRAAAERYARSGIEALKGKTMPSYEAMLKLRLARSFAEKGESAEALQLLKDADGHVRELMHPVLLSLLLARLHGSENQPAAALGHMVSALEISRQRRQDSLLVSERDWIVPMLVEVFAQGKMQDYITEIIGKMAPEASGQLSLLQRGGNPAIRQAASQLLKELPRASARGLQVFFLGKFRVMNDGREIPSAAWKSRKAKTLFQYLTHSRQRGYTNKEILMELLWPEEDPTLTAKRFHVALASLRKTLEPKIERSIPSAFISRVGDSYGIDPGEDGWADTDKFTEELRLAGEEKDAERSISHLLNAESYYGGDFLQEEPYSEWCMEARDKYKRDYLQLLKRIAAHYEHQGDHARAIEYCNKYLEVDKYAEDVCRSLMISYWEIGDKLRMALVFKRCREHITRELNCELSDETELLYRKLLARGP